jgi:RNA polymerase sigma-70 factor (ECF subfamily)
VIEAFNEHRQLLFGIAYRMLGQVSEAEDAVQEVWLRWQRQDGARIESPRAWLVAATTRLCIDQLRLARRQREEYYGVWLPEPLMETAAPPDPVELADSLSMAFMRMLEALGPVERAAFLLREVFDYDYAAVAEIVGRSEANCRQIVRRAKAHLDVPPTEPAPAPDDRAREVVEKFLAATTTGEIDALLEMLMDEATVYNDGGGKVRAAGLPIRTADRVSRFLVGIQRKLPADLRYRFVRINGRPGTLLLSQGRVLAALAFELSGERVQAIYGIWNPDKLRHLPAGEAEFEP